MALISRKAVLLAKTEYGIITILTGVNDKLDWTEDGVTKATTLTAGTYTPTTLAAHIQTLMRAAGDADTTAVYSATTKKITIANSTLTTLTFKWQSGVNTATNCGEELGFAVAADDTGALTYTADYAIGYAQDANPGVTDAFEVISDLNISPAGDLNTRLPYGNSLSPVKALLGKRWVEVSFVIEVRGSGTKNIAPRGIGELLKCCAMSETIGANDVTYAPVSSNFKSLTLYAYADGLLHKIKGCRGSFKLLFVTGQTAKLEFKLWGKYEIPTDVAIASPTYNSTVPPVVIGATLTLDAVTTFIAQQLELDINNTISPRNNMADSTGIEGFEVVGRDGKGSLNPEAVLVATYDFWTVWTASTEKQISIVLGATEGNIWTITCPKLVLEKVGYEDRNGIRVFALPFKLGQSSGNDEISIVTS